MIDTKHNVQTECKICRAFPFIYAPEKNHLMVSVILTLIYFKVIQNGVKPFLNETVIKSCFHVDL